MECKELAPYFHAKRKDLNANFVVDLEKMNDIVSNCKENARAEKVQAGSLISWKYMIWPREDNLVKES